MNPFQNIPRSPSPFLKTIREIEIAGRLVFLRLDLNVPLGPPDSEGNRPIEDETRIVESLPTIRYALDQGARLVIASHLGRPEGKRKPEFSLEPVAQRLATLLEQEVIFTENSLGDGIELMAQSLKRGQILMLENLRFNPGEELNSPEFAGKLAKLAEVFVNDAFGVCHRKHASTCGVPLLVSKKAIGLLIEKELSYLNLLMNQPKKPFYAILGGSKVSDKIHTIEAIIRKVDGLLVGGAMAHAFWVAQGDALPEGAKHPAPKDVDVARQLIREMKRKECPLLIPSDTHDGFDIGPNTIRQFKEVLAHAKTVFWNGPLGWFEKTEFSRGTFEVAQMLAEQEDCVKIVGGGDTVLAIRKAQVADRFDHLSTGGGAALKYLEGKGLPGIDILKLSQRDILLSQSVLRYDDSE